MPRSADRIAGKFFNLESHPSMRRNAPSPNQKFVFRRRVNSQGQSPKRTSTGVSPVALNRKSISLLEAIKMTDSVHSSEASPRKSTPVMRAGSTPRASIIDTGDGDVELIVEKDDGGVDVFEIVGQANVDGVRHLQEGSCFSRSELFLPSVLVADS
uniref:Uncharacterized protein n=1 Tax=Plectus sambesii TaxID=2011161 RepID=A0A914X0G6_9BILA